MKGSMIIPKISRGIRNNNPGNLRKTPAIWLGEIKGEDTAFKVFSYPIYGIAAIKTSILKKIKRGLLTPEQIIESYAPPFENDTRAYISSVEKSSGLKATLPLPLDERSLMSFIRGIILHENGSCPYSDELIIKALKL